MIARKQMRYPPESWQEIVGLVHWWRSPESLPDEFEPSAYGVRRRLMS